jgi:hypothetical protein
VPSTIPINDRDSVDRIAGMSALSDSWRQALLVTADPFRVVFLILHRCCREIHSFEPAINLRLAGKYY